MDYFRLNKADYESLLSRERPFSALLGRANDISRGTITGTVVDGIGKSSSLITCFLDLCRKAFEDSLRDIESDPSIVALKKHAFPVAENAGYKAKRSFTDGSRLSNVFKTRVWSTFIRRRLCQETTGPISMTTRGFLITFANRFPLSDYKKHIKRTFRYFAHLQRILLKNNLFFKIELKANLVLTGKISAPEIKASFAAEFTSIYNDEFISPDVKEIRIHPRNSLKYVVGKVEESGELGKNNFIREIGDETDDHYSEGVVLRKGRILNLKHFKEIPMLLGSRKDDQVDSLGDLAIDFTGTGAQATDRWHKIEDHPSIARNIDGKVEGIIVSCVSPRDASREDSSILEVVYSEKRREGNRRIQSATDLLLMLSNPGVKNLGIENPKEIASQKIEEITSSISGPYHWNWVFFLPQIFQILNTIGRLSYDESEQSYTIY